MKRVKSGCIFQTLVFSQKAELGFTKEETVDANRAEIVRYKKILERSRTRYVIVDESVLEDGSIVIHIKKQLNDRTDTSEYFH